MNLYTYRLTVDSGDAPNPYGNICSLAICKPSIRRCCKVNDWIVGLVSQTLINKTKGNQTEVNNILYAMRVTQKLTFEEYDILCKEKFKNKLPKIDKKGDCLYYKENDNYKQNDNYKENDNYKQRKNYAHNLQNMKTDLGGKFVILSDDFYYFGKNSIKIPKHLEPIIIKQQGHQKDKNKNYISDFITFIRKQKQGINGTPYEKISETFIQNISKCSKKIIKKDC